MDYGIGGLGKEEVRDGGVSGGEDGVVDAGA